MILLLKKNSGVEDDETTISIKYDVLKNTVKKVNIEKKGITEIIFTSIRFYHISESDYEEK